MTICSCIFCSSTSIWLRIKLTSVTWRFDDRQLTSLIFGDRGLGGENGFYRSTLILQSKPCSLNYSLVWLHNFWNSTFFYSLLICPWSFPFFTTLLSTFCDTSESLSSSFFSDRLPRFSDCSSCRRSPILTSTFSRIWTTLLSTESRCSPIFLRSPAAARALCFSWFIYSRSNTISLFILSFFASTKSTLFFSI